MNHPIYDLSISESRLRYEFTSIGPKGVLFKVVEYTYSAPLAMWNLGFGDLDLTTGKVSDSVVSNNGDGRKVMATVVSTLLGFFSQFPDETVIFTGSDDRRTLVYKRIILYYYPDFADQLLVNGLNTEGIEQPIETDVDYLAFVIRKK